MLVRHVMTVRVVTTEPAMPVKELISLLVTHGISGVPVVEDGRVVGMVSESDVLPSREGIPRRPVRTADDVMTQPVISLSERDTVTEAARVLERHRIKRAPVLREDRLVGIVTRSDLLRPYLRTDTEILAEVEDEVLRGALGLSPRSVSVRVRDGVVTLSGLVASPRQRSVLVRLTRNTDGVVDVVDELEVRDEKLVEAVQV